MRLFIPSVRQASFRNDAWMAHLRSLLEAVRPPAPAPSVCVRLLYRQPGPRDNVGVHSLAATRALCQRTTEVDFGARLAPIEREGQRYELVGTARRAKDQDASWWHPEIPFVRTLGDWRGDQAEWTESWTRGSDRFADLHHPGPLDLTSTLQIGKLCGLPARGLLPTAALPGIPSWTWRAMNLDT
jgi:hypothetical protein